MSPQTRHHTFMTLYLQQMAVSAYYRWSTEGANSHMQGHRRQTLRCRDTEGTHSHMQGHRRDAPAHAGTQKVCAHTRRDSAHYTALLNSGVPLVSTKQTCPTCVIIIESVMEKLRTFTVFLNRYHSRAYCVWVVLLHLFHTFGSLYISLSLFWIYTGWLYMEAAENGRC